MQATKWFYVLLAILWLSGCTLIHSEPLYHVKGWGYTTGYSVYVPRSQEVYIPTSYGYTAYSYER